MIPVADPFMAGIRPAIPLDELGTRWPATKIKRLTQSVLSSAGECLLKAQYTLDQPVWVRRFASSPRAVGTGFHAGLELYYVARRDGLPLPTLDDCIGRACEIFNTSITTDLYDNTPVEVFLWDDNIPDQATAHSVIGKMVTAYWPHHWPDDWSVLAVELNGQRFDQYVGVDCKVGADLVLIDPNNSLIAADFKTGKRRWPEGKENPRKNIQAPFYSRLLRQIYPGYNGYRFAFDIMTYPNAKGECVFERRYSDPQAEHEQAVAEMAKGFVNLYNTVRVEQDRDLPANPSSTLCNPKWCDFWDGCPHGARLDSVAQIVEGEGVTAGFVRGIEGPIGTGHTPPFTLSPESSPAAGEVRANSPSAPSPAMLDLLDEMLAAELHIDPIALSPDPARLALVDARGALCPSPDEGADWSSDEYTPLWEQLRGLYDGLDYVARAWRSELVGQATRRHVPFYAQGGKTERRFWINKAVIALAYAPEPPTDILRELLAHIIGDVALYPGVEPGHALGSLNAVEAQSFAHHVDAYLSPPPAA